jgi:hypothetical protein
LGLDNLKGGRKRQPTLGKRGLELEVGEGSLGAGTRYVCRGDGGNNVKKLESAG